MSRLISVGPDRLFLLPITFLFFLTSLFSPALSRPRPSPQDDFELVVRRFQEALEDRNLPAYGSLFLPVIREEEVKALSLYFSELGMDSVVARRLPGIREREEERVIFFHVLFQNFYAALIETWRLTFTPFEGTWQVSSREVPVRLRNLYRLKIPSTKVERVESIEIEQEDILLSFRKAIVFYDNIPDLETALLIIGPGRVVFQPSDLNEKHQLKLMYRSETLQADLDHAYLRFSPVFFSRHIKIKPLPESFPPSSPELEQASRLFSRYRERFFSVENSLTHELLSALPQGEEVVIEFHGPGVGNLTYVFSPFGEDEITLYDRSRDRFISLYSPAKEGSGRALRLSFGQPFDILHYDIEAEVNPRDYFLAARAAVRVVSRGSTLESLRFRLNPKLNILRILDGEGHELVFNQDRSSRMVYVPLIEPVGREPISLQFFYRGRLEPPPSHSDVMAMNQEEDRILIPLKFESFLYSHSALWYPSPPDEDYFTARVKFVTPADMTCIGQGLLLEAGKMESGPGEPGKERMGRAYWLYESKVPLKYLAFLVGRLDRLQELRGSSSIPLELFSSQEFRLNRKGLLEEATSLLTFYERLFGPYPYEVLRIILRFWETGGGHSPASLVILNELPKSLRVQGAGVVKAISPVDLSQWNEYFLAHEMAHQWWGQAVTWQRYRDQWLSEGLAQFATALYLKEKYGSRAFTDILRKFSQWTQKKSRWGPIIMGSRLSYLDFEAFQTIIYNKSSLALNMLCDLLGEEVFFKGLKEFVLSYRFRPATTGDFFRVMERVSGRDLKAFALGWFERYTLPHVRVQTSLDREDDHYRFTVKVEQIGDIFVFPLWVEWKEDGKGRREMVLIQEKVQEFRFDLSAKPQRFRVNPEGAVPAKFR